MPGLIQVLSNGDLDRLEAERQAAEERQAQPLILGLAAYLRDLFDAAEQAKGPIQEEMLKSLRQRAGEYEADKLAEISEMGGSAIYMLVTETKCRAAESWLRDILMEGDDIPPFALKPTPEPELPSDMEQRVHEQFAQKVIGTIEQMGNAPDPEMMEALKEQASDDIRNEILEEAQERADKMQVRIRDQFTEGGMRTAFDDFISDLVTYPAAFIKGPIVTRRRELTWVPQPDGTQKAEVKEVLAPTYKRVSPFYMYPEPGISAIGEGYNFEHHRLTRSDLSDLLGVPGYDDGAIRAILEEMSSGGLGDWMKSAEMERAPLENKHALWRRPTLVVDTLEFYGRIPGRFLLEWGMTPDEVPDPDKEYDCNAWLIDRRVIKATLNYDPLGKQPYHKCSMFKLPGAYWGRAIPEVIRDVQNVCNAAARALVNNMGIASGPQVEMNIDRLPQGEEVTSVYPWKIWQVLNDPLGSGQPALRFTQPSSNAQELMTVYQHFSKQADDQSGIPAYVYGDMQVGGAGRTASGLSMLMGSAGKGIRQVVMHIDGNVTFPAVEAQYNWNMRYDDDLEIKGDVKIVPMGAVTLANREQLNVRRVEFLQATANPIDAEIVGKPGRAAILREVAKGLSMPVDEIVPSKEKLEVQDKLTAILQAQQQAQPQQSVQFQRDDRGQVTGAEVFPGGAKKGGADANTVSNKQTGGGG